MKFDFKSLFQGKKKWFFIGAIVIVVILGFMAARRGGSSSGASYDGGLGGGSIGGLGGTGSTNGGITTNDVQGMIGAAVAGAKEESEKNFQTMLGKQESYYDSQIGLLTNAFASRETDYLNNLSMLEGRLSASESRYNESMAAASKAQSDILYAMSLGSNSTSSGSTSSQSTSNALANQQAQSILAQQAVAKQNSSTGIGGANYNNLDRAGQIAMENDIARLKSDAAYRAAEEARAKAVIAERQKQGMDTKAQTEYLKKLNEYKKAG